MPTTVGDGDGIVSGLRSTQLVLTATHIDVRGSGSIPLYVYNGSNVLVANCFMLGGATYVILLERAFEAAFTSNTIYGPTPYGIYLKNGPGSFSCIAVSIYANTFRGASTYDIFADTNAVMIRAQGNVKSPSSNTSMTVTYISSGGRTIDNDIQTS